MTTSKLASTLLSLALLAMFGAAGGAYAQHPTEVTSIVNSAADTSLEVNHNGSLLMSGTLGPTAENDSIPAEGAGTRLMWYPAKAALRAGVVSADQWDADNVGVSSVALGRGTEASDPHTVAMGFQSTASGLDATAMGSETTASGRQATAMGRKTTASAKRATAMGLETTASGDQATAMGLGTVAATPQSFSTGQCNSANSSLDNTLFVVGNGNYDFQNDQCSSREDVFTVDASGSATASSHDTFSDRRLKTEIEPVDKGVMDALQEIDPVRYRLKDQATHPSGEQIGLIAQDVQKEFPALVTEGAGGMLSLAYPKMTAILLKGLQEQQTQLEKKQSQIDSLEERVQRLEKHLQEIDRVKSRLAALEAERSPSVVAGWAGSGAGLLLAFLLGGLLGAALLGRRDG